MIKVNGKNSFILDGDPLPVTNIYPFRFGIISDLQVGEQFAIYPPTSRFKDPYGTRYVLNKGQRKLWKYFNKYIEKLNVYKVNCLLVVGDLVAGKNPKEGGTYTMNVELPTQKLACASLLAYICEQVPTIRRVYIWRGTPYHGSKDTQIEEDIARILKADYNIDAIFSGPYSYLTLKYGKYKKTLWVAHPMSNAWMYLEQAMGRNILFFQQAIAQGKIPRVDMTIQAHKHEFVEIHRSGMRSIILPCWQFFVPYDQAVKYYAKWQPDIGGVILLADEQLRLRPWHFTYKNFVDPERFLTLRHKVEEKNLS